VVESTHEGVWGADLKGTSVYANQRMAEMLGCTVPSIVGKSVFKFVFAEDRSAVRERLEGYLKKPSGTRAQERLRRADGSELWTLVSASVFYGLDQKPAGFLGMFTDISDHKQAQDALEARVGERTAELEASHEALAENELKFRRLFETIADAAFIFDGETRQVLEANDAALRLYGYSRAEFLKLRQPELTAEPEETETLIQLIIAGAMRIPLRYHKRRDGTAFPVEISAGCFRLQGRILVCGVVRDISFRKTAEEALQRREQELSDFFADAPLGLMWVAPGGADSAR
jgi:PAS domain S-box-containing protein